MRIELAQQLTAADAEARTITGTIVTWDEVGQTSAGPACFSPDSITPSENVTLRLEHERTRPVGRATSIEATDTGMVGTFKIIATAAGNDALVEAAEGLRAGLSVGVEVIEFTEDTDGTLRVTAATMDEVSLVTHPAIKSALVHEVAASEDSGSTVDSVQDKGDIVEESTAVEAPAVVTAAVHVPVATVQDAFPYREGVNASFFKDMTIASMDMEAAQRVSVARNMLSAAQKTTSVSEVIPPGYRPDLYVGEQLMGRPIADSFTQYGINDATPFTIPVFKATTGLAADHVEGTNPSDGTLAFDEITITPKAVSGQFTASREMLDAANPSLDAIIMRALREAYDQKIEGESAAFLEAQSVAGTDATGGAVTSATVAAMAGYTAARMLPVTNLAVGSTYFSALAGELDSTGRPLNPYLSPSNSSGSAGSAFASLNVGGLNAVQAWSMTTGSCAVYRGSDFALWTSSLLSFRFEEVAGPAQIRFAQFGYAANGSFNANGSVLIASAAALSTKSSTK